MYLFFQNNQLLYLLLLSGPQPRQAPGLQVPPALPIAALLLSKSSMSPGPARPGKCGPGGNNSFKSVINNKIYSDARIRNLNWHIAILPPPPQVLVTRLTGWVPFFVTLDVAALVWVWGGDTANLASQATNRFPAIYTQTHHNHLFTQAGLGSLCTKIASRHPHESGPAMACTPTSIGTLNLSWLLLQAVMKMSIMTYARSWERF